MDLDYMHVEKCLYLSHCLLSCSRSIICTRCFTEKCFYPNQRFI